MKKLAALAALGASSVPAFAIETAAVTAELTEAQGNVETIGAAVLVIAVVIAVFKYVRKAL